ncbi:hypothetical protein GCT13_43380 [Paraburkholderia sp. CNPSo 3157]|uniref:Uncharacterized protein n=1 Tax=Paraburkholderia franconis TaxID=2654983 RepID=A0A7X1TL49_9BURK|nr:hypothetical protein [Paraburkholderia franconis]
MLAGARHERNRRRAHRRGATPSWVSPAIGKHPRGDARWRPFNGPLWGASDGRARMSDICAITRWRCCASVPGAPRVARNLVVSPGDLAGCPCATSPRCCNSDTPANQQHRLRKRKPSRLRQHFFEHHVD